MADQPANTAAAEHSARHPDFSGQWEVDRDATTLGLTDLAGLQRMEVDIVQSDSAFSLRRLMSIAGRTDHAEFVVPLDGREHELEVNGRSVRIAMTWSGRTLQAGMRIPGPAGTATNDVRYAMSDDGARLVADESFTDHQRTYHNRWVMRRRLGGSTPHE